METLDRRRAEQLLRHSTIGRLGCFSPQEDRVYVVPVSYRLRGRTVYFSCLPGQKMDFLRAHPKGVSLEVDRISDEQDWVSVVATGHVEELSGDEYLIEERAAIGRAQRGPLRWDYLDEAAPRGHRLVLFGLRIEEISGRGDHWWAVSEPRMSRANQRSKAQTSVKEPVTFDPPAQAASELGP